jgi:hypothetical protein
VIAFPSCALACRGCSAKRRKHKKVQDISRRRYSKNVHNCSFYYCPLKSISSIWGQRHHCPALRDEIQPPRRLLGVPRRVIYPPFMTQAPEQVRSDRLGRPLAHENQNSLILNPAVNEKPLKSRAAFFMFGRGETARSGQPAPYPASVMSLVPIKRVPSSIR